MNSVRVLAACALVLTSCSPPPDKPGARRPKLEQRLSPPVQVVSVRALPNDRVLTLTADGNAAMSDDGGDSWATIGPPGKLKGELRLLDGIGFSNGALIAVASDGIFKSVDGRTWTTAVQGDRRGALFLTASTAWFAQHRGQLEAVSGSAYLQEPGLVTAVEEGADRTLLVASFGKGVFRSQNGGTGWDQANQGLDNLDVTSLASLPGGPWLAGTFGGGVYRSQDGRSWARSSQGLEDVEVQALATDGKSTLAGAQRGLFRSADGGQSWARVGGDLAQDNVQTLAIDARGRIFAGTWGNGLYRSADGGATWSRLWLRDDRRDFMSVALGANGRLYIGARSGHVYSVRLTGGDWQELGNPCSSPIHDLAVTPKGVPLAVSPDAIYRYDLTSTWTEVKTLPVREVGGIAIGQGSELLIRPAGRSTAANALFVSTDDGATWTPRQDACLSGNVDPRLSASPDRSTLMSGCRCVSTDGGKTWTALKGVPSGYECTGYMGDGHAVAVGSNNSAPFGVYHSAKAEAFALRADLNVSPQCVTVTPGGEVIIVGSDGILALPAGSKKLDERARGRFRCTHMLAAGKDALVMVGAAGVHASTDGGRSWKRLDPTVKPGDGAREGGAP